MRRVLWLSGLLLQSMICTDAAFTRNRVLINASPGACEFCPSSRPRMHHKALGVPNHPVIQRGSVPCSMSSASLLTDLVSAYETATQNAGLATDMVTVACINTFSDSLAQLTEQLKALKLNFRPGDAATFAWITDMERDAARTLRLATFGIVDGAVSHYWFIANDSLFGDGQGLVDTLGKTAADALIYTPIWCAWFLLAMAILQSESVAAVPTNLRKVPTILRSDWLQLFRGNVGFFLPLTGLIYGFVPREERVLAFGLASLVYTTILSLWNNARDSDLNAFSQSIPPPPAAPRPWLQFAVRRVFVGGRRSLTRTLNRLGSRRPNAS